MHCVITAGPTYESLDEVRRLTNFSSGQLGSNLANHLAARGHEVTLLLGLYATWRGEQKAHRVLEFTTTSHLHDLFEELSGQPVDAVFHAAAVSDFKFGRIFEKTATGELIEVRSGKVSTRSGTLLAELVPTPKIIASLREWYPSACLVGWKYEVDGDRAGVVAKGERQQWENRTNASVVNGPAYGPGYGLTTGVGLCRHLAAPPELYSALESLLGSRS